MPTANPTLDEILFDTPEPQRSFALEAFLADEDPILVKAHHGGGMECRFNNVKINGARVVPFSSRGRLVSRRVAIEALYLYGRDGIYTGKHQATGFTPTLLSQLKKDEREDWISEQGVKFQDNYLTHVWPNDDDDDDDAATEKGPATT